MKVLTSILLAYYILVVFNQKFFLKSICNEYNYLSQFITEDKISDNEKDRINKLTLNLLIYYSCSTLMFIITIIYIFLLFKYNNLNLITILLFTFFKFLTIFLNYNKLKRNIKNNIEKDEITMQCDFSIIHWFKDTITLGFLIYFTLQIFII